MAENLGEAILELRTKDAGFGREIDAAKKKTDELGGSMEQIGVSAHIASAAVIAAFASVITKASELAAEQERVIALVDRGVRNAGASLGLTSKQIQGFAKDLQAATGVGDEAILKSQAVLLSFHRVTGDVFKDATRLALDMSEVLGTDLHSQILQLGKALEDPAVGLTYLSRSGTTFTQVQKDLIKEMVASNNLLGAQRYILAEVEKQYGGAAEAVRGTATGALRAFRSEVGDALEVLGSGLNPEIAKLVGHLADLAASDAATGQMAELGKALGEILRTVNSLTGLVDELGQAFGGAGEDSLAGGISKAYRNAILMTPVLEFLNDKVALLLETLDDGEKRTAAAVKAAGGGPDFALPQIAAIKAVDDAAQLHFRANIDRYAKETKLNNEAAKSAEELAKRIQAADKRAFDQREQYYTDYLKALGLVEQMTNDVLDAEARRQEALLRYNSARQAASIIDLGKLEQEVYWEEQRAEATKLGAAALIDFAAAKARADYVDRTGANEDQAARFEAATRKLLTLQQQTEKYGKTWEEINRGFGEAVGKGLHDAAIGFLSEMERGLTDSLPSGLKVFADALISAANEWLVQMLKNIATAKAAGSDIGGTGSGSGGGGLLGAAKGLFGKGGGGGAAGVSWVGVASFAAIVAYGVYRKHQRDSENKKRYEFAGSYSPAGSVVGGNNPETGRQAVEALRQLYADLADTLNAGTKGIEAASINVRRDHQLFEAMVGGELVGRFKTLDQAILAASAKAFEDVATDPALKAVLHNAVAKFASPDELNAALQTVKGLSDLSKGLSDTAIEIQSIVPHLEELRTQLRQWGVDAAEATRLVGAQGLKSFTDAWRAISGEQESPEQLRARKEQERQILLAQIQLERATLTARKAQLEAALAIAKGEVKLDRQVIDTRSAFIRGEDELWRIEGKGFGQYLQGRGELVGLQADVLQAELDAVSQYLDALGGLIDKVSLGKISVGNFGGGRTRGGRGGRRDELNDSIDRLIDAIQQDISAQADLVRELTSALDDLSGFLADLKLTGPSPLTPAQQILALQDQLRNAAKAAQGGDLDAIRQFQEIAARLKQLGAGAFGTGTAGFEALLRMIEELGQGVLDEGNDLLESELDHLSEMRDTLADILEANRRAHDLTQEEIDAIREGDENALREARNIVREFGQLRVQASRDQSELRDLLRRLARVLGDAA